MFRVFDFVSFFTNIISLTLAFIHSSPQESSDREQDIPNAVSHLPFSRQRLLRFLFVFSAALSQHRKCLVEGR
jgi:hypothetical protein